MEKSEFKILVAEDDAMVRDVIEKFLSGQGYSVIVAKDGHEAIKRLRLEEIRLVLTDLRMPGADGMEVLRAAVRMDPRIAVVLITAYGTLDTALEAMQEGAYDYIVKPFVMQQLLLVVRNAYRLACLIKENERLSNDVKEMYRRLEAVNAMDSSRGEGYTGERAQGPSLKGARRSNSEDTMNTGDVPGDKERPVSGHSHDKIKKYSSLIEGLKSD